MEQLERLRSCPEIYPAFELMVLGDASGTTLATLHRFAAVLAQHARDQGYRVEIRRLDEFFPDSRFDLDTPQEAVRPRLYAFWGDDPWLQSPRKRKRH